MSTSGKSHQIKLYYFLKRIVSVFAYLKLNKCSYIYIYIYIYIYYIYIYTVEPLLLNNSQVESFRVRTKHLSKKYLSDRTNVQSSNTGLKPMKTERARITAEQLTESTRKVFFQFSNKSVVEHNFGTNYVRQPRFHNIYIYIYTFIYFILFNYNFKLSLTNRNCFMSPKNMPTVSRAEGLDSHKRGGGISWIWH